MPRYNVGDNVITKDNHIGKVDNSWWDSIENCYMYEVATVYVHYGIYKETDLSYCCSSN